MQRYWTNLGEQLTHCGGQLVPVSFAREKMAVDIERHGDRGMPEQVLHLFRLRGLEPIMTRAGVIEKGEPKYALHAFRIYQGIGAGKAIFDMQQQQQKPQRKRKR
jgi:hypothetical protein